MSCSLLATKLQLLLESAANCCRLQQMSRELAAKSMNAELAADCCCLLPAASLAVGSTIDNHTLHVAAAARVGSKKYEPCLRLSLSKIFHFSFVNAPNLSENLSAFTDR